MDRVQDVRVHADDERGDDRRGKSIVHASATAANVMAIKSVGKRDIRACIEAARQLLCLVVKVALDLESALSTHGTQRSFARLRGSTKSVIQFQFAPVRQVRDSTRETQATDRRRTLLVVVAAMPLRVRLDELNLRGLNADLPGTRSSADTHDQSPAHVIRVHQRPLQRTCTAERATDHRLQVGNPKFLQC